MSKSRMWSVDEPAEAPSPRTTIVGGRPPEEGAELPPVPTGIQQLLRLAAVDESFRGELVERRGELAEAAGVELSPNEQLVLRAVPSEQLLAMIEHVPPPAEDRRTFLRQTAATAVMLLGGAALATTSEGCTKGHRADVPPERPPQNLITRGAVADPPPPRPVHNEMESEGGISPHLREPAVQRPDARSTTGKGGAEPSVPGERPLHNEMGGGGGARAPLPEERAERRMPAPGGAAPDVPRPRPDAGPPRPKRPQPTRGIRADVPHKPGVPDELNNPFKKRDEE